MGLLPLVFAIGVAQAASPASPTIPFETFTLDNGLTVILSEDHSVPIVQVNVWYHVGSKDEPAGRSGFAHLFEHLMFQGSAHLDEDYFVPLQAIGARINGTTNTDRTNYFEGVPSEYLPLALWMESDRMGWLLPALTQEKLDNQKDVVRNERRQRYENPPYGEARVWLMEALYPESHPYHIPTIGRHEDIEAATLEDVSDFFRTWYVPNNATLVVAGDFDPAEARGLVQATFGDVARGADPTQAAADAVTLDAEVVVRKEKTVPLAKVWMAWHTPPFLTDEDAALDVVASALSDGKDSRLYRTLVTDKQIARDIAAYQGSARLGSAFVIQATAADGHTTDELVAAVDEVLAELLEDGVTQAEVDLARTNWEAIYFDQLQTVARKADLLAMYETWKGDPGWMSQDLARYASVTAESATAQARAAFVPNRVVLHITPPAEEAP